MGHSPPLLRIKVMLWPSLWIVTRDRSKPTGQTLDVHWHQRWPYIRSDPIWQKPSTWISSQLLRAGRPVIYAASADDGMDLARLSKALLYLSYEYLTGVMNNEEGFKGKTPVWDSHQDLKIASLLLSSVHCFLYACVCLARWQYAVISRSQSPEY